ncbi:GNAT family N-acetyltransferase [Shinella zoogloeoides]|uniref:GNAT family N-acetyltransferase n=1 Tax=Shinella zoogloeoides TaxID=352475 RepID=UPI00299D04A0|nr:GNAT family N-acetyltransferase [Shinella zoogloeoides]WPE23821.1 Acetyltransferase [Shinella zoogloeoides]
MTTIPVVETDRLLLRGFRPDDLDAMAAMWVMPEVVRYIGGVPQTREQCWVRLLRQIGMWSVMGFGFWAITERATGALIGEGGFHEMHRTMDPSIAGTMEAGWGLMPAWHGRGYASEALDAMLTWADATHRGKPVTCIIAPENAPSMRLARRHGFAEFARTLYQDSEIAVFRRLEGPNAA